MSALPEPCLSPVVPVGPAGAAWWRHLFVESEDAQLVCDRDGVVCAVNRKAEQQFGLAVDRCLFECGLLAPGAASQLREALGRAAQKTETIGTIGITCPNGACLVADLQLAPFDTKRWLLVIKDASR